MKRVLVIAAHPDDEVLGLGGTIAKLSQNGAQIHLLIVTDGSTAQYRDSDDVAQILRRKKEETKKAADILGISSVTYADLPDMQLDTVSHIRLNQVISDEIEAVCPDTVFTHFAGDINLDHRLVFESTMVAVRPVSDSSVRQVFSYRVPSSTEWAPACTERAFCPNYFVDISSQFDQKKAAVLAYQTELRGELHPRSLRGVEIADAQIGITVGVRYAEAFILVRQIDR